MWISESLGRGRVCIWMGVGLKVFMIDFLFLKGEALGERVARQLKIEKMSQYTDSRNLVEAVALRTVCRGLHAECRPRTIYDDTVRYRWTM